jgi:hypothetical protein
VEKGTSPADVRASTEDPSQGLVALGTMRPLALVFLLLLVACGPATKQTPRPVSSEPQKATAQVLPDPNGWSLSSETDKMDKSPEVMLFKQAEGSPEGLLTIRCSHRKTELIVKPGEIVDSGGVRIKLDDSAPLRQTWGQATNYQGLFAPDAIALARQLTKTETFLFEYQPFQQRPHTVEFKVGGLAAKMQAVADACEWAKLDEAKARAQQPAKLEAERTRNREAWAQQAAELEAERTRKREAMIRVELSKHVELCRREALREKGYWCWYDEADEFYKNGGAPAKSKEGALENAIERAKIGVVFKRELSQIDAQLK